MREFSRAHPRHTQPRTPGPGGWPPRVCPGRLGALGVSRVGVGVTCTEQRVRSNVLDRVAGPRGRTVAGHECSTAVCRTGAADCAPSRLLPSSRLSAPHAPPSLLRLDWWPSLSCAITGFLIPHPPPPLPLRRSRPFTPSPLAAQPAARLAVEDSAEGPRSGCALWFTDRQSRVLLHSRFCQAVLRAALRTHVLRWARMRTRDWWSGRLST